MTKEEMNMRKGYRKLASANAKKCDEGEFPEAMEWDIANDNPEKIYR